MILYRDTRGAVDAPRSFTEAILEGIAPGGGLFVPERLPQFGVDQVVALADVPYHARAAAVYEAFGLDVSAARTRAIAARAYGPDFDHPEIAPVVDVAPGRHVLELWHGPTLAFKDMALQCMPLYFSEALEQAHAKGATDLDFLILVATSGDTGVAALNGYADRAHTRICVFYPDAGVSALQELQMVTQPGDNLTVYRLAGDFDACQTSVKAVFDDEAFAAELAEHHGLALSSANSINWGRLLPQIVYYMSGYADLAARGAVAAGDPIDVCVPTGNFGNILAAWYARDIGVPVRRLLCASNTNNVLYDFLSSGVYDIAARSLVKTPSPSMDILISSNLERLLYDLTGDPARIAAWMGELKTSGRFAVDDETHARLTASFTPEWVDNDTCLETIGRVQHELGYLLDPHTAVAWEAAERLGGDVPVLIASTAHWSKFAADVVRGLTGVRAGEPVPGVDDDLDLLDRVVDLAPGASVPPQLRAVRARPRRFDARVEAGREPVEAALRDWLAGS
ncbi:MAG: threonine synthase [Actinobacteria bacterium]|nr:threonine synthase [Actinomycetota bacterium]